MKMKIICQECGMEVGAQETHTFEHCRIYKEFLRMQGLSELQEKINKS